MLEQLITKALENPGHLAAILGAVLTLIAWLLGTGVVRRRRVALATYHAFNVMEDVANEYRKGGQSVPALEKISQALGYADEWMKLNGWRPLKLHEQALAKLSWQSMHGEQKSQANNPAAVTINSSIENEQLQLYTVKWSAEHTPRTMGNPASGIEMVVSASEQGALATILHSKRYYTAVNAEVVKTEPYIPPATSVA
jgi:hypothetical protein